MIHAAPALRTTAICFLFTYLIGTTTAMKVVRAAITNITSRSSQGKGILSGSSINMKRLDEMRVAVIRPHVVPRSEATVTTMKAS